VSNRSLIWVTGGRYPMAVKWQFYYHTQAISVKKSGFRALLNLAFENGQCVIA